MLDIVIVMYNPDLNFVKSNIGKISNLNFINEIIIVDNSKIINHVSGNKVSYLPQFDNLGIAQAQNIGIKQSILNENTDAVILFDQDSILEGKMLEQLYSDFSHHKDMNIAAIGPITIDSFSNKKEIPKFNKTTKENNIIKVREIIASGKLINKAVLNDVGLMDEGLFIDGVDHEWCWRANNKNYDILLSLNAKMIHTVGDSRIKLPFISLKVASPIRMYYQYRNFLLLIKRNHTPLFWKIRNGIGYILKLLVFTLFVSDKKERSYFIKKGIIDGVKGKKGRIDD